jgi:hypothetical protein
MGSTQKRRGAPFKKTLLNLVKQALKKRPNPPSLSNDELQIPLSSFMNEIQLILNHDFNDIQTRSLMCELEKMINILIKYPQITQFIINYLCKYCKKQHSFLTGGG